MKCIHCGHDSQLKDRVNGFCRCGKRFAFEPTSDSLKITDVFFQHVIEAVSSNGTLSFTERQLWYEFSRRLARGRWWTGPLGTALISFFLAVWLWGVLGVWSFVLMVLITMVASVTSFVNHREKTRHPSVPLETFTPKYLSTWTKTHGPIEKLIPSIKPQFSWALGPEPDLTAYSFDRVIVTDQFPIAAMLVANNFHFEHNCAILSLDGYPGGRKETILDMLQRNSALTVFALHDASASGCPLPSQLRQPEWFPDRATTIFDLGLRPRHVIEKRWMTVTGIPQTLPDEVRQLLTPSEEAWLLAGHIGELAVLRPAALMRAIYRGIGRSAEAIAKAKQDRRDEDDGGGGGGIWIGPGGSTEEADQADQGGDFAPGDFDGDGPDSGDAGADSFG